jgi:penicillin-binding protein 1A
MLAVCALVVVFGLSWFFFYSRDLPDLSTISQFAPRTLTKVSDPCLQSPTIAIPYDGIGDNLRSALSVAEAGEDGPTAIEKTSHAFSDVRDGRPALAFQISRTMFCSPTKAGSRGLKELRLAVQLERHFTRRELFTIAANRYYFGADLIGVQEAAQHFLPQNPEPANSRRGCTVGGSS